MPSHQYDGSEQLKRLDTNAMAGVLLTRGFPVPFRITGRSMSPLIKKGDRVVAHPAGSGEARLGDIVLIKVDNAYVTHRFFGRDRGAARDHIWHKGDRGRRFNKAPAGSLVGKIKTIQKANGPELTLDNRLWRSANRVIGIYHYVLVCLGSYIKTRPAPGEQIFNSLVRAPDGLTVFLADWKRRKSGRDT